MLLETIRAKQTLDYFKIKKSFNQKDRAPRGDPTHP